MFDYFDKKAEKEHAKVEGNQAKVVQEIASLAKKQSDIEEKQGLLSRKQFLFEHERLDKGGWRALDEEEKILKREKHVAEKEQKAYEQGNIKKVHKFQKDLQRLAKKEERMA